MTNEVDFECDPPSETSFSGHLCIHCGMLTTQCKCTPESLAQKEYHSNVAFQQRVVGRLDQIIQLLEQLIL